MDRWQTASQDLFEVQPQVRQAADVGRLAVMQRAAASSAAPRREDDGNAAVRAGAAAANGMQDEYSANMEDDGGTTFILDEFVLESGRLMHRVPIRFKTWGVLNEAADNCLVVCHALTGNGASRARRSPLRHTPPPRPAMRCADGA